MELFSYILNVLYFLVFNHTSCGKHGFSEYGPQYSNVFVVNEVIALGEFIVFVKDAIGGTWYHSRFHMLNLLPEHFPF